jgi:DNA-binding MarR family transcriptional regulator
LTYKKGLYMRTNNMNEPVSEELQALKRIEELLALLVKAVMAERLEKILADKAHRLILEQTGKLSVRQLAKKSGLSTGAISRLWQEWEEAGLIVKDGKQFRRVL